MSVHASSTFLTAPPPQPHTHVSISSVLTLLASSPHSEDVIKGPPHPRASSRILNQSLSLESPFQDAF